MPSTNTTNKRTSGRHRVGDSDTMTCPLAIVSRATAPIAGQKPGTSGLRKKTREFMSENFLDNFVQSTFNALLELGVPVAGGTLVISGDGRFFNKQAIQVIAKIAVAAGVARLWVGKDGLLSTPAVSAVIRSREGGFKAFGGFILSASHNPGGIDEDFGIKYNSENGGPAPEKITDVILAKTKVIEEIRSAAAFPDIDVSTVGTQQIHATDGSRTVTVEVFDCTEDHVSVLQDCFDFGEIRSLLARPDFSICYDAMHGVQGPYAKKVLCEVLGAPESALMNCEPKEDFGGPSTPSHGHADPNLVNARQLCDRMGVSKDGSAITGQASEPPTMGAAADGDADRNMILGARFFVTPSDSLAMLVDNASLIPFFARGGGLKGAARSMPTSSALDRVCRAKGIPLFETPTGWKFFGNLMDTPQFSPFICGEESFGTGSNHVREKDGMWAVLAWLQILARKNSAAGAGAKLIGVEEVARSHWATYGRNYYARYDYEGVDLGKATAMMERMAGMGADPATWPSDAEWSTIDTFEYTDPVDGSVSKNQGQRFILADGSRIIFRLSGTGVVGATVRLYLDKYEPPTGNLDMHPHQVVAKLGELALKVSLLAEFTGRDRPSVIT